MHRIAAHRSIAVLALVTALLLAGCGGASTEAADEAIDDPTPTRSEHDDGIVLATVSGGEFALNDVVGTPTMLWFWAPW